MIFAFAKNYLMARVHPFSEKPQVFGDRAPENRNEVRFLGRGGAERACEHCRFAAMREGSRLLRLSLIHILKALLDVELSLGQMVEDVRLSVAGKKPVFFYGRTGGNVPSEEEIVEQAKKALASAKEGV